jgi:hypothetical protein
MEGADGTPATLGQSPGAYTGPAERSFGLRAHAAAGTPLRAARHVAMEQGWWAADSGGYEAMTL